MYRKTLIFFLLAAAAILFFAFDLDRLMILDTLKRQHIQVVDLYERRPLIVVGGFLLIHITALTLSIPGSVLSMALAAGAVFGPVWGTLIVLSSLTIGDSLGFLVARHLLREPVQKHFGGHLARFERGIERDGPFFLFAMRLMAIVPFFVVNLTMGLTRMPLKVFAPVSFLGLVPAAALYVSAGTQLSLIKSPWDIYSSQLMVPLVLLGIVPLLARLAWKRRLYGQPARD